jgi:peptidoglycan/LPS O-acetylase OafA/YrhL
MLRSELHCTVLVLTWSVLSLWFGRFDSIGGFGLSTTASILVTVAGVALSVASAALTYRYVEIPARDWLRRRAARSPAAQPS